MDFLEAVILGILQGLTEFLPISSSAHLRIFGDLAEWGDPGATFTAITQLGTETAVLIYFWRDITRIIGKWFRSFGSRGGEHSAGIRKGDPDVRMGWLIIIGTVPIVLAGFFLQDAIRTAFRSLWIVAIVLIVFGLLLGVADLLGRRTKELDQLSYRDGILVGFAQMLALIPGVSRSGASVSAGLALGYTRPAAARFAFLLAVPAVFGSGLYELYTALTCEPGVDAGCTTGYGMAETLVATVVAFVVGLAVIAFLMRYIERRSFLPFVIYRILLGGTLIVLLSTGVLQP
ncbi:undecaprenyl-diphosphate phosphatase [Homoserinibacter sp. GY 40078]|uniref:undecaprenyl-diphosphate phosphatase n=1 Tax=Homoserinibacter sp. GY 40078 TaxID=2603275 RepID=UPI0011CCC158|nr:undecaprenyl-diphosphate phosphatase [Homoserinibacter sp. GY 40078]TXK17631.1 undecaprenyl-diphosphate phosphatase [Homoserinibacter sp. GY 40078]